MLYCDFHKLVYDFRAKSRTQVPTQTVTFMCRQRIPVLLVFFDVNRSEFSYVWAETVFLTRKMQLKMNLSLWKKNTS